MPSGEPKITMEIQEDSSVLFKARDNVTIRVSFESPTQVRVEMWRETDTTFERVAPDTGNIGSRSFRDKLLKQAKEVFDPLPKEQDKNPQTTIPNLEEDLGEVAVAMGVPAISDMLKPEKGTAMVDLLVETVEDVGELFTTPEGEPHALLEIEGRRETHEIRGSRFRRWLRGHFYAKEKARLEAQAEDRYEQLVQTAGAMATASVIPVPKPPVVRDQTLSDAIAQLEAKADYERRVEEVYVRVGDHEDKLYIDLGNDLWNAVEIDAEGWRIVDSPPVRFVRPKGMQELPEPVRGGSIDLLKGVLTLGESDEDKRTWVLIATLLVNSLRSSAPEFPILILTGAQGSAKSTTSRILRAVLDPNVVEDTGEPRSKEELHIDADCSWLLAYDNLSGLSPWLSDAMCRISTGSAFTKRVLYSNRDREIFKAAQPQVLNGISDVVSKGDIIDRGLLVTLPVITEYREKGAVWEDFEMVRPLVMGALYDAAAAGLKSIAEGEEIRAKLPRMADYAKWSIRVERALGFSEGAFLEAFTGSREEGVDTVLEAEPISYRVFEYARNFDAADPWQGTTNTLLKILNERESDERIKRDPAWPKAANKLSGLLGRIAPALEQKGVVWERAGGSNKRGKIYNLYYVSPEGGDDTSEGGDDTGKTTVPHEDTIDKLDSDKGTVGDYGDDRNPGPEEDGEEMVF